jgi:hypothetical protein
MPANIQSRTFCLLFCCLKSLNRNLQNYDDAYGSVWVWNLVSDIKGGTQTEGVWDQPAEENICVEEGWSDLCVKVVNKCD